MFRSLINSTAIILLLICGHAAANNMTSQQLWSEFVQSPDTHPNLPDFSYAGYGYGERPIPDVPVVANVRDHGARGDGQADDTAAFHAAIAAAKAAGGGAVLAPAGTYRLSDVLRLTSSNLVLRGEGPERTSLVFDKSLTDVFGPLPSGEKSRWSWLGALIWIGPPETFDAEGRLVARFGENWRTQRLSPVVAPANMGGRVIEVEPAAAGRIEPGQMILMTWTDPDDRSFLMHLGGHPLMARAPWGRMAGSTLRFPVEVVAVNGNRLTLRQPLRFDIRPEWNVQVHALGSHVAEVGVEELQIRFPRHRVMPHLEDVGFNGVYMNRAVHSWLRNVTMENVDVGFGISAAKNTTATGLRIIGQRNHHATALRNQSHDNLIDGFVIESEVHHGINTEALSSGNVWRNGVMRHGTFDSHRAMSFDSLRENITINSTGGPGGANDAGPFLGRRMVHWNIRFTGGRAEWVACPDYMPMGALVGIQGTDIHRTDRPWAMPPGDKGCIIVDHGRTPEPGSLYEAQLRLRLERQGSGGR